MTGNEFLVDVSTELKSHFCRLRDDILESPSLIRRDWLQQQDWIAVPREQHGYVSMLEMERLDKALTANSISELVVIYPTIPSEHSNCKRFSTSLGGLMEAATVRSFNYFITNVGGPDFIYHHTDEDFNLTAGSYKLVEEIIGASIEAAQYDWHQNVTHPGWSEAEKQVYREIELWYQQP